MVRLYIQRERDNPDGALYIRYGRGGCLQYRYILMSEGVKPEDTVFIDGTEENGVSAKKLGICSIWFKDDLGLRSDIERHLQS